MSHSTAQLRSQILQAAFGWAAHNGVGMGQVLRSFAHKHVVTMTRDELEQLDEVLQHHTDEQLEGWMTAHPPPWLLQNSSFMLLRQFHRYWHSGGSGEYR
mmetsp:Transcript_13101/g.23077  ORF Transcript_13101/g.23077 Transcript_13101/m.23077 type:complete len:100 (+) Transcript_13101:90-389(+)